MIKLIIQEPGSPSGLVDRTGLIDRTQAGVNITTTRGQVGTATITLRTSPDRPYFPEIGWPVWIYENYAQLDVDDPIYVGVIGIVEIKPVGKFGDRLIILTVPSLEKEFDNIIVEKLDFAEYHAGTILTQIFGSAASQVPVGVGLGTIDLGVLIHSQSYDGKTTSAWQAFTQLASASNYIVYIHPLDQKLYFHAQDTHLAPWALIDEMILKDDQGNSTIDYKQDSSTFINQLVVQLSPNVAPMITQYYPNDGSVFLASPGGPFPIPGGFGPIGGPFPNVAVGGNQIAQIVSAEWTTANGTTITHDPAATAITAGAADAGNWDLNYIPGTHRFTLPKLPPANDPVTGLPLFLKLTFIAAGNDTVVSSSLPPTGMPTRYQRVYSPQGPNTLQAYQDLADSVIEAYNTLPAMLQFTIDWPGLYAGMWLTINCADPGCMPDVINGEWIVQQVQAQNIPGMDQLPDNFIPANVGVLPLPDPGGHLRYTVQVINSVTQTPQDMFNNLNNQSPTRATPPATSVAGNGGMATLLSPPHRLLLKDLTVGTRIADSIPIMTPITRTVSPVAHAACKAVRLVGVLRKTITADLTVQINLTDNGSPSSSTAWTITMPSGTLVDTPVVQAIGGDVFDLDILSADILAGDGSSDPDGICSVSLELAVVG